MAIGRPLIRKTTVDAPVAATAWHSVLQDFPRLLGSPAPSSFRLFCQYKKRGRRLRIFIGILGSLLLLAVLWDAFETMILPRRVARRIRLTSIFYRLTWLPWAALGRRRRPGPKREAFLSYYGPLSTILLLVVWAAGIVFGFAMIKWAAVSDPRTPSGAARFADELYASGTNYFVPGLEDTSAFARFLTVAEAGLGLGFLAMVVGYLPVLYSAFSRREVNISLMDSRAGAPSTTLELLSRYRGNAAGLDSTLQEFERWTAEMLESHISYPVLSYFRSQHDNQSWLGVITTILDTCSLVMTGLKDHSPWQAQLTFAIARHTVVDVAQILRTPPLPPVPNRLPPEDFTLLRSALSECRPGISDGNGYERLAELRALYEPYVYALSHHLEMRLPQWVSHAQVRHNWETSAWGRVEIPPEAM